MKSERVFKVYLSLYKKGKRIEREERDEIIKTLMEEHPRIFYNNKNKDQDKHYPIYYDDRYYFGDPIVLDRITEDELAYLLSLFKVEHGLSFWITHLNERFNFEQIKKKLKITNLRMDDERAFLFLDETNLVNEYKNKSAVIQDNTHIKDIIEATR